MLEYRSPDVRRGKRGRWRAAIVIIPGVVASIVGLIVTAHGLLPAEGPTYLIDTSHAHHPLRFILRLENGSVVFYTKDVDLIGQHIWIPGWILMLAGTALLFVLWRQRQPHQQR